MMSLGSRAAPDCRTGQSKGRYCVRAASFLPPDLSLLHDIYMYLIYFQDSGHTNLARHRVLSRNGWPLLLIELILGRSNILTDSSESSIYYCFHSGSVHKSIVIYTPLDTFSIIFLVKSMYK
jgi:hypothetical protein